MKLKNHQEVIGLRNNIPSLRQRNYNSDRLVRDEVVPGAEWVLQGEGTPTRKWDGTSCMVRDGKLYKRYDGKKGRTPPEGFEPCQEPDPVTGHWPGWLPVTDRPEDKCFNEGFANYQAIYGIPEDGTYELCGPKINGNPDKLTQHILIKHGSEILTDVGKTFAEIKNYLKDADIEGIVWHHSDGRMAKIKKRDFGFKR